jgi:hypothetical protein
MLWHDGMKVGYRNIFCVFPEEGLAISLLMNGDDGPLTRYLGDSTSSCYDLAHAFLPNGNYSVDDPAKYVRLATEKDVEMFTPTAFEPANPKTLDTASYIGDYRLANSTDMDPVLTVTGNATEKLIISMSSKIPGVPQTFKYAFKPWAGASNFSVVKPGTDMAVPYFNPLVFDIVNNSVKGFSFLQNNVIDYFGAEFKTYQVPSQFYKV